MGFRRILIAVDDSPIAARAADVGVDLARSLGAELAFVHATAPSEFSDPESGIPVTEFRAMVERDSKKLLERFQAQAGAAPPPLTFAPVGTPATEIVKAARDWSADVIIMGSHGRSGISRVLLGSVAEGVMRHAPCPVLIVRAHE